MQIITDGTIVGTKILDDNGNVLSKVAKLALDFDSEKPGVKITMLASNLCAAKRINELLGQRSTILSISGQ